MLILLCVASAPVLAFSSKHWTLESLQTRRGFTWKSDHSPSFDYFFEPASPGERDIEKIKGRAEGYRAHVLQLLGETATPFRAQIFIVDSRARMKELSGMEVNGWANGTVQAVVYNDSLNALGAHEDLHLVAAHLWGRDHNYEAWLDEGLAVYADDHWRGYPLHGVCKSLLANGKLIPIQSLLAKGWNRLYPDMVTYPELGSFVKFLYEKYGMGAVKATWQQGSAQMPRVFGKSLSELEQEWRSTIESDASSVNYEPR